MGKLLLLPSLLLTTLMTFAQTAALPPPPAPMPPPPMPPPGVIFRPTSLLADEQPVAVTTEAKIVADNGLYRRVETMITFTNPNGRAFEGELEFPVPDGAIVCGYALEINGSMIPGVVVPKEEARVAFENEKRKGVDPGLVEHVKGNVWKTRIYPLMPRTPRKAMVAYLAPNDQLTAGTTVSEKCGDEIFVAKVVELKAGAPTAAALGDGDQRAEMLAPLLREAQKAVIYWDASMSRRGKTAADRNLLECLPECGEFTLVVFRNVIESPIACKTRAELLAALDALVYDGGTCLDDVLKRRAAANVGEGEVSFLFSDEYRPPRPRRIRIEKFAAAEAPAEVAAAAAEGALLATAWAANRVEDLAGDEEANKPELLELGRKYGVASPVTSLIVLETLAQYQTYKIEPPACMSFYAEWKKWRAAEDDPIAKEKAANDYRATLLSYWEERVKWWNDPVPPKRTPKSGLFEGAAERRSVQADAVQADASVANEVDFEADAVANEARVMMCRERTNAPMPVGLACAACAAALADAALSKNAASDAPQTKSASIKIAAWDPKMPYLDALNKATEPYAEYLKQRELFGTSPAFYLDCAGWFFKANQPLLGARIISNLSEMKLEDVGLWRTMGWRLREAALYDEAIAAFRHVLKMRPEEPQSKRDLALVLTEAGKLRTDDPMAACQLLSEAAMTLGEVVLTPAPRRSGRRGNDFQTAVFALEELNGLISWARANKLPIEEPLLPEVFRRELPCELRIMLSWDTDETDVDLHVLEPDGEEAFYGHRRTSTGGFVSEDVTTGYGPEEYLRKEAPKGVYRILANYFASHRQQLTGAATITATIYTGWGTAEEKRQIMSLRLDKPKDKHPIGEIEIK